LPAITLDYGAGDPLVLEPAPNAAVADCRGPDGVIGAAARRLVADAIARPSHGPPLAAHVVPGDRVVVAVAGDVPQASEVLAAVSEGLTMAGVAAAEVSMLHGPPLDEGRPAGRPGRLPSGATEYDPAIEAATSYLAADESARPLYLARALVDADVVVALGGWGWNAALGGRSLEGELWPVFSRLACRRDLAVMLARRGRHALPDWKSAMQEVTWQLGVCASLRLVAGRGDTLAAAAFGLPDEAARLARAAAAGWCPSVPAADVAVVSLGDPAGDFTAVTRALAAAARVTRPGGTVCVACRVAAGPGIIFERWRQGAPLERLVHEAAALGDPALVADALETRLFARALGDRRLVLLSGLDESTVEELGFGHAASPEAVERLAHRAESLVVLHEADRMLPQPR
jgi:hypothetical protein